MTEHLQLKNERKTEEKIKVEAVEAQQEQAAHEASLTLKKFLRILKFRLTHQGLRVSFWWIVNILTRRLTGHPHRTTSEVSPNLFVGGQYWPRGWRAMQNWGISAVVNLRQELDDRRLGVTPDRYLYLPTPDDYPPSLEQLYRAVAFINQEIASGGKVYVHCGAGVGRAVITATAYLINTGMSADQALATIRKTRPFINPSAVQLKRLDEFAADWEARKR